MFESYSVTMVASVMLGYAAFGYKGMIFPLLVQAVGVVASIISTALVGRGIVNGTSAVAMHSINNGFCRSALISVVGFMALGYVYLTFDAAYIVERGIDKGMYQELYDEPTLRGAVGLEEQKPTVAEKVKDLRKLRSGPGQNTDPDRAAVLEAEVDHYRTEALAAWRKLSPEQREKIAGQQFTQMGLTADEFVRLKSHGIDRQGTERFKVTPLELAQARYHVPLKPGVNLSIAWCCLIGIILAVALNKCTEYWTSTEYSPVKEVVKASRTGHATNIISGLGARATRVPCGRCSSSRPRSSASVAVCNDTQNLLFMAFGVAMCGIGMLTLTGDTISMDVFGPVADNANGIGEMAFTRNAAGQDLKPGDADYMTEAENKSARQILADLDAVGNTTKAITKGIAIGSAVIAAVSLFASFIAVLVTGSEEKIGQLTHRRLHRRRVEADGRRPARCSSAC